MARESSKTRRAEIEELRLRLEEAQQALDAIRTGQVESLVVEGKDGPRIFSLEDANHSYRALVEAMSEGAATLAEDGAILYCNSRFARMLGAPLERVMGGSLRDCVPDGSRSSLDLLLLQAREGEARGELHLRAEDGQEVPVQLSASTLHEEGRRVLCVVVTDLREQKQSQQVLAEGQLARSVLEQAADAIVVCDEKGRITRASRTAEQLCGCCPLRAHFDAAFPVVLVSPLLGGNLIANALRGAILRAEPATLTRVDGSQADLLVSATPLQAEEGRIIGCVITMVDVSEHRRADEALRESETRFRSVLEDSRDVIYRLNLQTGHYDYISPAVETVVGYSPGELLAMDVETSQAMIHPDDMPAMQAAVARLQTAGEAEVEYRQRTKHGDYRWLSNHMSLVKDGSGRPLYRNGNIRDITESKRAEEALEGSRQRLAEVLNSIQDDFYVLDRDWRFTFVSRQFTSRIGKTPEDFLGNSIWEMFPKHVGTAFEEHLRAAMDKKETRRFEIGGKYTDAWYQMTVFPSEEGVTVLGRETTESKKLEEALRASERLYRAIGESNDYGVWVCAPDGRNTYASQSFLHLVGLTQEQCSNFGWGEILHPDDAERTIAAWKECVRTGGAWDIEHRFRGVDGEWHPILARGVPVKDEQGEITCWAGINLDISALKQTEEALREADRRKNEFLATLSHELRNPLAPIRNSAYVLERCEPGSEQAKRALAVVNRQAAQLAHLVDDLLDVTRITRNKIQLQRQTLDLNELARQAVEDQRTVFDQADVRVDFHPAAQPVSVSADRDRLAQIIGNLLQNAAKFTGRGGKARVAISVDATEERAVIQVADTGDGMTPDMLARLFQPFSQADPSLDRSKGGLGLGLALTKGLVELHGGNITARSAGLGQGAEFVVRLPLAAEAAPALQPTARTSKVRRRVLIIEDNVDVADSLRDILVLGDHEVEVAYNGPQGLGKAEDFRPDVVFCDIGLPIMNGYEVARAFLANDVLKHTFLVALSGYAMPEDLERASAAGFKRHLAKPPSQEKLEEVLNEAP